MAVPLIELPPLPNVAVDVAAWFAIHAGTGYAVHRLSLDRLQRDGWLLRPRRIEDSGRLYERLAIRRWKDLLPEAGALFAGGMSKRALPAVADGGLERFAAETRRAELGHWLAMAGGPLFVLWNPAPVAAVMIAYGVAVNAPFIAIQRYNRARVSRCLERRSRLAASSPSTTRRRSADMSGNNMPNGSPPSV
jgi:glycosyl-4,4'-diaponeurosporenoate acyltransferase